MGDMAFQAAAPRLQNALPSHLSAPLSVEAFKKHLKHLFKSVFFMCYFIVAFIYSTLKFVSQM